MIFFFCLFLTCCFNVISSLKSSPLLDLLESSLYVSSTNTNAIVLKELSPDYRGVFARSSIPKGTDLFTIDEKQLITYSQVLHRSRTFNLNLSCHTEFALFLLDEIDLIASGKASTYKAYIQALPNSINSPRFWSKEELNWLSGSHLFNLTLETKADVRHEYSIIPHKYYSLAEFEWARAIIASRLFNININGKATQVLAPLADLLNHGKSNADWSFDDKRQAFLVTSDANIEAGHEILFSYGSKSNAQLLHSYGFVLELNANPSTGIVYNTLHLDAKNMPLLHDMYRNTKERRLGGLINQPTEFTITINYATPTTRHVFSYYRFAHASSTSELNSCPKEINEETIIAPLSSRNEISVLTTLARLAQNALTRYSLQLSCATTAISRNHATAILLIRGEISIAHFFLRLKHDVIPLLRGGDIAAVDKFKKTLDVSGPYATYEDRAIAAYLRDVVEPLILTVSTERTLFTS
jgi:hypothetical protein